MTNSAHAKALMETAVAAETALDEAMTAHLQEWLALEVRRGGLTSDDISHPFRFVGLTDDSTAGIYESETDVDRFGEIQWGEEVQLPLAFLDDPAPFYAIAEEKERKKAEAHEAHELRKLKSEKARAEAEVVRIKERIAKRKAAKSTAK